MHYLSREIHKLSPSPVCYLAKTDKSQLDGFEIRNPHLWERLSPPASPERAGSRPARLALLAWRAWWRAGLIPSRQGRGRGVSGWTLPKRKLLQRFCCHVQTNAILGPRRFTVISSPSLRSAQARRRGAPGRTHKERHEVCLKVVGLE